MKGKYFLDKIDNMVYSTNDYTLWNFYRSIFYGKPFPGGITKSILGAAPNWNIITFNGKVIARKIKGKYEEVE
jgi:hypothetical protein